MAPPPWNPEASLVSPSRSPRCALAIRQWHQRRCKGAPWRLYVNRLFCIRRSGSSNEWASSYGSKSHQQQEVADLCGKLSPIIERLALLNEGKVGHNLKVFKRLATTVKEMAVQKCL
ncbi:BnaC06g27640D [Brassica napus]|uniref:BnaC06g27640D protein n=1 Tax=Brassica napus TaxID=3708 RepID=A0A078HCT2_BRANA|nr:BnaC06g27640D [Brassica napus]